MLKKAAEDTTRSGSLRKYYSTAKNHSDHSSYHSSSPDAYALLNNAEARNGDGAAQASKVPMPVKATQLFGFHRCANTGAGDGCADEEGDGLARAVVSRAFVGKMRARQQGARRRGGR